MLRPHTSACRSSRSAKSVHFAWLLLLLGLLPCTHAVFKGWTQLTPGPLAALPSLSSGTVAVHNDVLYYFGGTATASSDMYAYTITTSPDRFFKQATAAGTVPTATRDHIAHVVNGKMFVTELGSGSTTVYHYDIASNSWAQKRPSKMAWTSSCSYAEEGGTVVWIFGGQTPQGDAKDDLYTYDFTIGDDVTSLNDAFTYIDRPLTDPWPERRYDCALVVYNQKPWLFGGFRKDLVRPDNEVWHYEKTSNAFIRHNVTGTWPHARFGHKATLAGNYMYMYGGKYTNASASLVFNDLWRLNLDTVVWEYLEPSTTARPSARHRFTFIRNGMFLYLHGGRLSNEAVDNELWSYQWTKPGPLISNITASDPDNGNVNYDNGDVIDVYWSEATNQKTASTKGDLDTLFSFSANLGTDYTGVWVTASHLRITITNIAGAGTPPIGSFTMTPKFAGGILNQALTSQPAITQSGVLLGNWGVKPGPNFVSVVAADPDDSSVKFDAGDTLTLSFNMVTNRRPAATKAQLDALFTFSQSLGTDYTGNWISDSVLRITMVNVAGAAPPVVGTLTVTSKASGGLTDPSGTTSPSAFTSTPVTGTWGNKAGPTILRLTAMDLYDLDSVYGKHDVIRVTFSEATNRPPATTKAELDALLSFLTPPGADYRGSWFSDSALDITIVATAATPPQIGVWHVNVTGNLLDKAETSFPSRSQSPLLEGNWGRGPKCNYTTCGGCLANATEGCGWCESTRKCYQGDANGPFSLLEVTCPVWNNTACTDCRQRTSCWNCTANPECGWCPTTRQCAQGNSTHPYFQGIACATGWTKTQLPGCPHFVVSGGQTPATALSTTEAGGSASFTVRLVSPVAAVADVVVAYTVSDATEGRVAPEGGVRFVPAEAIGTTRTVTLTGVDDPMDDGDVAYTLQFAPLNSTDANFRDMQSTPVYVINTDDDTAGYNVTVTRSLNMTEGGANGSFQVSLLTQPTVSPLWVRVASQAPNQVALSPDTLVFTTANWATPQHVEAIAVDDLVADGTILTTAVVGPANGTGHEYATLTQSVNMAAMDNDVPGVLFFNTAPGVTDENGRAQTFQASLRSRPTHDVTLPVRSSNPAEGSVSPSSLVFTPANWDVRQSVTVTGVDDQITDGNITYSVVLGAAASSDAAYQGISASVAMINLDNDPAGLTCLDPTNPTSETGEIAYVRCRLISAPQSGVTVSMSSDNVNEGMVVAPGSMTFSPADWNTYKSIAVRGVNDWVDDGSQYYRLQVSTSSTSTPYHQLSVPPIRMVNEDDDTAGIFLLSRNGSLANMRTSESGTTLEMYVRLESEPVADVRMPVINYDPSELAVDRAELTFTAANWNVTQAVVLNSVPDTLNDGAVVVHVLFGPCLTTDPKYNLKMRRVQVINSDQDASALNITWLTPQFATPTRPAQFLMVLTSQPTATVRVPISVANVNVVTSSVTSHDFTLANWNVPVLVTLTATSGPAQSVNVPLGHQGTTTSSSTSSPRQTLYHALVDTTTSTRSSAIRPRAVVGGIAFGSVTIGPVVSTDPRYGGLAAETVEVRKVVPSGDSVIVAHASNDATSEGGAAIVVQVQLVEPPSVSPFDVSAVVSDPTEGTLVNSTATLRFTTANWNVLQSVTVQGVDDTVVDGTVAYALVLSPPAGYTPATPYNLPLRNLDLGDTASIVVENVQPETNENGFEGGFDMRLTSQPSADVSVAVSVSNTAEAEVVPGSSPVVFTPSDWATPRRVRIRGLADGVTDPDVTYLVTFARSVSGDPSYNGVQLSSLSFVNRAIVVPRFASIDPSVVTVAGGMRVHVDGADFVPGIRVELDGVAVANVTRYDSASLSFAAPVSTVGATTARLVLRNPDNGSVDAGPVLRYVDACPTTGQYATDALQCQPCPAGGQCPGGSIINARAGYWNSGPTSGFVFECVPRARCAGNGTCGAGYKGLFCGSCTDGYYRSDEYCVSCGHEAWLWLTWIVYVVAWLTMWWLLFAAEPWVQTYVLFALVPLQMLRVIGHSSPANAPEFLRLFYHTMGLLDMDYDFLRPGCGVDSSLATFSSLFWGNTAILAINLVVMLVGFVAMSNTQRNTAPLSETFANRFFRTLLIYVTLAYPMWAVRTMQALHCTAPFAFFSNSSFLLVELSVECYSQDHDVAAMAWIIMIALVLFYPLFLTIFLVTKNSQNLLMGSSTLANTHVRNTFGVLYERMTQPAYWFVCLLLLAEFLLAFASVVFIRNPEFRFLLTNAVLATMVIVLAIVQPFETRYLNPLYSAAFSVGFVMAVINFVAHEHFQADVDLVRVLAGFMILFVLVVAILFAIMPWVHRWQEGRVDPMGNVHFRTPKQQKQAEAAANGRKSPRTPRTMANDRGVATPRSLEEDLALESARGQRTMLPKLNLRSLGSGGDSRVEAERIEMRTQQDSNRSSVTFGSVAAGGGPPRGRVPARSRFRKAMGPRMAGLAPLQPVSGSQGGPPALSEAFLDYCRSADRANGGVNAQMYDLMRERKRVQDPEDRARRAEAIISLVPRVRGVNPIMYEGLQDKSRQELRSTTALINLEKGVHAALLNEYQEPFEASVASVPKLGSTAPVPRLNLSSTQSGDHDDEEWERANHTAPALGGGAADDGYYDEDDEDDYYDDDEEYDEDDEEYDEEEGAWDDHQDGGYGRQGGY